MYDENNGDMEMKKRCFLMLLLIACTAACATETGIKTLEVKSVVAPQYKALNVSKIAILVKPYRDLPLRIVEDEFMKFLIAKGYTISSRSDVETIKKELKFQHSDFTDKDMVEIGKILNVPALIIISINDYRQENFRYDKGTGTQHSIVMGARAIDVETTDVIWLGTTKHADFALNELLVTLSQNLGRDFPARNNAMVDQPIASIAASSFNKRDLTKMAILASADKSNHKEYSRKASLPPRVVEDEFMRALIGKGYKVPSRSDVTSIMGELKFQYSGLTDDDAVSVGKMLNVPAIVVINRNWYHQYSVRGRFDNYCMILGARIIDVQKAEILWVGTETLCKWSDSKAIETELYSEVSEKLASSIPPKS